MNISANFTQNILYVFTIKQQGHDDQILFHCVAKYILYAES